MGLAGREFAETLSWDAVLDGLVKLHSQLAGVSPGPSPPPCRHVPYVGGPCEGPSSSLGAPCSGGIEQIVYVALTLI